MDVAGSALVDVWSAALRRFGIARSTIGPSAAGSVMFPAAS
jgi:hypothetical protein